MIKILMMKVKVLSILVLILALCMITQTTMAQRREKVFSTEGWWKPAEPPFRRSSMMIIV